MSKKNRVLIITLVSFTIFFSANTISFQSYAGGFDGTWTYAGGEFVCIGKPYDCTSGIPR